MSPKLYMTEMCPPARAVLLTAGALGIDLERINCNIAIGENRKPEYLKINPQHTIPTLDDNGTIIWDSPAISTYLVSKYGKDDSLYPKDLAKRAKIDQRLHFNTGCIFVHIRAACKPITAYGKQLRVTETIKTELEESYAFLEKFLGENLWVTGNTITVADFCLIATVTSANVIVPIDCNRFPKISAWIKRAKNLHFYQEANQVGLDIFKQFLDSNR